MKHKYRKKGQQLKQERLALLETWYSLKRHLLHQQKSRRPLHEVEEGRLEKKN